MDARDSQWLIQHPHTLNKETWKRNTHNHKSQAGRSTDLGNCYR